MSSAFEQALLRVWMLGIRQALVMPFMRGLETPGATQQRTLRAILDRNRDTEFGRTYRLGELKDDREFRAAVPIHEYEQLRPYIEVQLETGRPAITSRAPEMCTQTSGTTGRAKNIPLCSHTMRAFRRTQSISTFIQHRDAPGIFDGTLLAIVSPLIEGVLAGGTPFGSMSGVVRHSLPRPIRTRSILPELAEFETLPYDERYRLIAAIALCSRDLSCLASANPSTFLRLAEVIDSHREELLQLIVSGDFPGSPQLVRILQRLCAPGAARVAELRGLLAGGDAVRFSDLWPKLAGVVTWTSGNCSVLIPRLRAQLDPAVKIIDMGYLASEFWGTVIVDIERNLGVPTIGDNFFEFIEPERWERGARETRLLGELEVGKKYYIISTTPNGLYRYFINDLIEVTGHFKGTPTIAFVQKGKGVTTLTGEKLYEGQVSEAVQTASEACGHPLDGFIMLADRVQFLYTLYCESAAPFDTGRFAAALDRALAAINREYAAKVASGRLPSAAVKQLAPGTFDRYKRAAIAAGQREGQFKMIKLNYTDQIDFKFDECLWTSE